MKKEPEKKPAPAPFPAAGHDHQACVDGALARAAEVCALRDLPLTENRRAVLRLLLESHRPLGAYELVKRFDWGGRRPAPAQIYRALRFLESLGLAHRIVSRNAYLACYAAPGECAQAFLVCERCGAVAECGGRALEKAARSLARAARFEFRASAVEISGRCPDCAPAACTP